MNLYITGYLKSQLGGKFFEYRLTLFDNMKMDPTSLPENTDSSMGVPTAPPPTPKGVYNNCMNLSLVCHHVLYTFVNHLLRFKHVSIHYTLYI